MKNKLIVIAGVLIFVSASGFAQSQKEVFTEDYITSTVEKACDWQLNNLFPEAVKSNGTVRPIPETGWIRGVFYTGVMAAYRATEQERFLDSAYVWGQKNRWQLGHRIKHADEHVVGQTYADLYEIYQNSSIIEPTIHRFNYMIETPEPGPVVGYSNNKNWSWCDALYMAPPAMVKVGVLTDKPEFLYLMNSMWWETYLHLYSEEDSLFYRDDRFVIKPDGSGQRNENGKKVFWSRGNGWVLGGLAKVLTWLPEDYTTRPAFEEVYLEMASKIASLQQEDGFWRSSLYDPDQFKTPESSGSAFFCFALAWGINEGFLDKEQYLPVVKKSWQGLNEVIDESGKLGYVQQVGSDPRSVSKDDSMEYGTAAFLLAGEQVLKLVRTDIIN